MTAFAVQLKEFADKTNVRADAIVRTVVSDIASALVDRSPVGDPKLWKKPPPKNYTPGRFRGNWQLGVNTVPAGETGRIDPAGDATLTTIIASIPEQPAGTILYLQNNAPYARPIEDGWSSQAPAGLVGITAIEFQQRVDAAALAVAA